MQTIQLDDLANVTGGCQCQQAPTAPVDPTTAATTASGAETSPAADAGSAGGGFQSFLTFLQSDSFKQLIGGIQGLIGGQASAPSAAPAAG